MQTEWTERSHIVMVERHVLGQIYEKMVGPNHTLRSDSAERRSARRIHRLRRRRRQISRRRRRRRFLQRERRHGRTDLRSPLWRSRWWGRCQMSRRRGISTSSLSSSSSTSLRGGRSSLCATTSSSSASWHVDVGAYERRRRVDDEEQRKWEKTGRRKDWGKSARLVSFKD